jgi:hypothetical protein
MKYGALLFMLNGKFERKVCFVEIDPTKHTFLSNFPFRINFNSAYFTSVLQYKNIKFGVACQYTPTLQHPTCKVIRVKKLAKADLIKS